MKVLLTGAAGFIGMHCAHRDFSPIQCLPDDCLLKDYDVPLPWKEGTPQEELKAA